MEYTSTVNLDGPFLAIFIALIARQPGLGHLKSRALSAHTSFQLTLAETDVESIHPWKLTCWTEKSPICNGKSSWKTSVILFHVNFPRCKVHCGCLQQVCLFPQMSGVQLLSWECWGGGQYVVSRSFNVYPIYVDIHYILPEIVPVPETMSFLCPYWWLSHVVT